ncbi:ATP-binding protein [Streptomyces viridosporus]|uniref:ATP-binding protein n=1 Tax=Streptomyces viridosporus TaxID=67581 RepID=UPI00342D64A3
MHEVPVSKPMATSVSAYPEDGEPSGLLAFRRLDEFLGRAVESARGRYGPEASADPFRGLYVNAEQAERSMRRPPGEPLCAPGDSQPAGSEPGWERIAATERGWSWLRTGYALSDFELDVVLLALAPEVDPRYERLYGYLQDDVNRRRPTMGLALDLLTVTARERLAARRYFGAEAPLLGRRVLSLLPNPRAEAASVIGRFLVLDEQIVDVLLDQGGLDRRLTAFCELLTPPPAPVEDEALYRMVGEAWGRVPLRLYFQGPPGAGGRRTAQTLAAALAVPLLAVDTEDILHDDTVLELVFREATLHGALLHLDDVDSPCTPALADRLAAYDGVVTLAGSRPWVPTSRRPLGVLTVPYAPGDTTQRRTTWQQAFAAHGVEAAAADLDALAVRFRLGPSQIEDAVLTARTAARLRTKDDPELAARPPSRAELFAAARAQTGHELTTLARRVEPSRGWEDIVLPAESLELLHSLCEWIVHRRQVMEEWGFDRRMSQGRGISALFAGPSGTGKTMAAEVVAHDIGLDLFKIDLSMVVSKYIGETEKNLERVFTAAADADAILFFDEADALFGKRSDVHDAHDRYANIEVSYLLQRMEEYDGLAILATNMRRHLDDAFTRRLRFIVEFPFPDDAERRRIWDVCIPPEAPRAPDVDLDRLARDFRLSGGNIHNIVLHAAFLAVAGDGRIGMTELLRATRREYLKMGKVEPMADPGRQEPL